ncbi:MAG: threonylcarbamoyl-AMP synthase [Candidatus Binataceae bacterium]|nr:threonylcarbamoyl-AMP synthase [Candidatus Binataceae bacterium]
MNTLQRTASDTTSLAEIPAAVAALRRGEVVVYPTETFYGLAVDPFIPGALDRLFAIKAREPDKTIALIASEASMAFGVASEVPPIARRLAEKFWPGALTLVLPARAGLPSALVGVDGGVGVRVSSHPIANALAAALGGCITATSANIAGQPPAKTVAAARASFGAAIAMYLDGGSLIADYPSTVATVADGQLRILREGAISAPVLNGSL